MAWLSFLIGWLAGIATTVYFISKDPNLPDKVRAVWSAWKLARAMKKQTRDFKRKGVEVIDIEPEEKT